MKKISNLIVTLFLLCNCTLFAQMPDSTICPNFTGVDLNGRSHNLYNYLDSGYTVIVEVSAAWCSPCWAFHTSGVLKNFYNQYGPAGTNQVRVFFVEGESTNTLAQLQGSSTGNLRSNFTKGDWITGTPYPIIDDASIARLLQINYFPTMYTIYPNRQIVEVKGRTATSFTSQLNSNLTAKGKNNLSILQYTGFDDLFCKDKTFTPQIRVQNMGLDTVSAAQIAVKLNNTVVETKTLTNLALRKYDTLNVSFNDISITANATVSFEIKTVNTVADTVTYRNVIAKNLVRGAQTDVDTITIELKTDQYPAETYWKVVDQAGTKIAEGGNPNVLPGTPQQTLLNAGNYRAVNTVYTQKVGLKRNTCYDIILWDDYGDGMVGIYNANGVVVGTQGYLKVWRSVNINVGTPFYNTTNADFEELKRPLERNNLVNGVQNLTEISTLTLYPSPVNGVLTVDFNLSENKDLSISVVNTLGQVQKTLPNQRYTEGVNKAQIVTADLANGIYFLTIRDDKATIVRKFMIQH